MAEGDQLLSREETIATQKARGRLTIFHEDEGDLLTPVTEAKVTREVYYIGIIDILQSYNAEKQLAHFFKSMKYSPVSIGLRISLHFNLKQSYYVLTNQLIRKKCLP